MYLDETERNYLAGWARRMKLWARIQERHTDPRVYEHSHNTDAATLQVLDNAGLDMARHIAQTLGADVASVEADMIDRCADDAPKF